EWERLRGWLNESRIDIRQQRQLAALAAEWEYARREVSFLLRGVRLETFEKWGAETSLALTPAERTYLQTSVVQRDEERAVEQEQKVRVKALEQRSVHFLRILVVVLLLAVLGAFGLTGVALNQSNIAQRNAAEAQNVALIAGSQAALANGKTDEAI